MIRTSILQNIFISLGLLLGIVLFAGITDVEAEEDIIGADEYRVSCMSCHGVGGKGNGPMAKVLKVQPSNLTTIAKSNEGIFPLDRVFRTIDGRHGVTDTGIEICLSGVHDILERTLQDTVFLTVRKWCGCGFWSWYITFS